MKNIAIIGGGLAGLSAAIRLRADGHHVTIFEKNENIGGKLNLRKGEGYTFDTGPSILTMPWVLEKLFASAGRKLEDYMQIVRIEPQWRTFFEDGTQIDLSSDIPTLITELQKVSPEDAASLFDYLSYCAKQYELCLKSFYSHSLSGLSDLRRLHTLKDLMSMDPLKTMNQATKRYFKDPHLQQLFDFLIMYVGSSPYHAPAVLSQLGHVQLGLGIYYVKGGMYNIARGMQKLLNELQVEIRTQAEVAEIESNDGRATGLKLKSGEKFKADIIVSNLEVIPAHQTLLQHLPASKIEEKRLEAFVPTVSGLVLLLGVNRKYDHLAHHNFFFSQDPAKEFSDVFDSSIPTQDPTIYVGISSKSDPSHAPADGENLFVLTHVPPLKEGQSWEEHREHYRALVLNKLERMGVENLRQHIVYEHQFIPDDLRALYGANGGSIYGIAADKKKNGGFKIPSRSNLLSNLYFVGGSTHPGGGVPMVTLSGQLTADLIQQDINQLNTLAK
jgi:diapolycopene oxygenase